MLAVSTHNSSDYLIRHVFSGSEGFRTRRAALLLPGLSRRVGELALQLKDLVLELLDVIDSVRQGGLLAHLHHQQRNISGWVAEEFSMYSRTKEDSSRPIILRKDSYKGNPMD